MSAFELIEQIKELPANEQVRVARFIVENGGSVARRKFSIGTEGDGPPVIRVNGGSITSQIVHEIESRDTVTLNAFSNPNPRDQKGGEIDGRT